jgi:hypothetical protein
VWWRVPALLAARPQRAYEVAVALRRLGLSDASFGSAQA